ncbi:MAG: NAD-dependent deacylase [Gammaproteobacteria bacterium]
MNERECAATARVAEALSVARRVLVLTGAGMSAASGLPTYRGIGGLYNAMEIEAGMPIEEILHAYTLARNPALTWKYIAQIEQACRAAMPNRGHETLARWDARFELHVVTQNVDGFHRAAGSRRVVELHGNLGRLFCFDCGEQFSLGDFDLATLPPRCPHCDGLVRPDVVLFGEMLPPAALAVYERELAAGFDVVMAIGTTAGFPYIHDPVLDAGRRGALTVEVNPDETPLSAHVGERLTLPAVEALAELDRRLA